MEDCKHTFGLKTRDSGEQYCPVCRKVMYGFNDMLDDWPVPLSKEERQVVGKPSDYDWNNTIRIRQRGGKTPKTDGR